MILPAVRCPRCERDNGEADIRCSGCGAPLSIAEVGAGLVERPLSLDRRSVVRETGGVDREPEPSPLSRTAAPRWRRALSWVIDGALLAGLLSAMLFPVFGSLLSPGALEGMRDVALPVLLLVALVAFSYQWLGVALAGATPGLALAGLRVVGPDGLRPSPGPAAARSGLGLLAAAPLGAGLVLAMFTQGGRGAHDLGAGTWVVPASRRRREG